LPLRPPWLDAAGLPLHTGLGRAPLGQAQRPVARPNRLAYRCAGRARDRLAAGPERWDQRAHWGTLHCGTRKRQGKPNQALHGREIDTHVLLDEATAKFINVAAARLGCPAHTARKWRTWPRSCSTGAPMERRACH